MPQPFALQPRAVSFGQTPAAPAGEPYTGNLPPELAEQMRAREQAAEEERRAYEEQIGKLRAMPGQQIERMFAARAPQEAAVAALGQRAATLEGGAALQGVQQARERAQAQAMVAARTPYGGKGASPEAAILGGQILENQGTPQAGKVNVLKL